MLLDLVPSSPERVLGRSRCGLGGTPQRARDLVAAAAWVIGQASASQCWGVGPALPGAPGLLSLVPWEGGHLQLGGSSPSASPHKSHGWEISKHGTLCVAHPRMGTPWGLQNPGKEK